LLRAYRHIRKDAPAAAGQWIKGVRNSIKTLAKNPHRCPLAPESVSFREPIRQLFFGKGPRGTYRILFVVLEDTLYVLHVRHGSRDELRPQE
jgi:plasmid stabilization system protein ParE